MVDKELAAKLRHIEGSFDIESLLQRVADRGAVARYYRINRLAYYLFHNHQGFVHMGISRDGIYDTSDLLEQARYVEACIKKSDAKMVLELAHGKGANSLYLAEKFPEVHFDGIDLPQGQTLKLKRHNLTLEEGDYHDLSRYTAETFDIVFVIEALCHSAKKEIVLREVKRILKPGGLFIIIDGYRAKRVGELSADEKIAAKLVEKGMMVDAFVHNAQFKDMVSREGFVVESEEDVSTYILPTLERFERKAAHFFKHPLLAKTLIRMLPKEFVANAISGYLMPHVFEKGIFRYTMLTLRA